MLVTLLIHSNLDLSAVNLGVYLDLVAISLLTEILLIKNSEFKRFCQIHKRAHDRLQTVKLKSARATSA